ncbi:DUF2894 domain-containing protein [Paraburkholderia phenazinium]|jgi:hypothetical protein|uniref:DUF2894 family protein n=1 Tax=Paraburkholderia phenazinium TaxID=60549 RepID=A0A1G7TR99_9BURK|nr:DUF2894 domain-containing protein [Paraburkholderia phenazinium]SDG37712.1 Protein of unknown function [Paraburkholderia phenazinium]
MTSGVRAQLDAWRERGADRLDPVRFRFIEALDRRAAGHSGEVRRLLDGRLSELLAVYADDLGRAALGVGESDNTDATPEPARESLAGLNDYIANHRARASASMVGEGRTAGHALPRPHSYPELEALEYFREVWSRFRTGRQLQQSLEQVPGNAGPLNSSSLVHRSLSLMRELSPGYLQQFLSYVDALSWMEQMNSGDVPTGKDAPRTGNVKKGTRGKAR